MNKFILKNRLHDYVDGELSLDERREVEAALNEHPDLMKEVEDIQEQRNRMLQFSQLKAPDNLLESILTEVESIPTAANKARSNHYLPFVAVATAALMAWLLIPVTSLEDNDIPSGVKGAQVLIPTANPIKIPTTSPIEEANNHLEQLATTAKKSTDVKKKKDKGLSSQSATKKTPNKLNNPTFIIKTPDSPYVPEWEEGHIIEVMETEFASDAFQFKSAPANLLFQLDNLVKRVGGTIKSTNGEAFSTVELTNFSPRAKCELWVPIEAVEDVNQKLTALGGQFFDEKIDTSGEFAIFKIDARYKYY